MIFIFQIFYKINIKWHKIILFTIILPFTINNMAENEVILNHLILILTYKTIKMCDEIECYESCTFIYFGAEIWNYLLLICKILPFLKVIFTLQYLGIFNFIVLSICNLYQQIMQVTKFLLQCIRGNFLPSMIVSYDT